jgi:hypothetical protein
VRPTRVLMAVSAAALVATACGDDTTDAGAAGPTGSSSSSAAAPESDLASLPPKEILAKAKTAITGAKSVHLKGGGTSGADSFEIDMRYGAEGKAYGTVASGGQTIELRRDGQTIYLKAPAAFWQSSGAGAEAAKLLGDKFLKAPLTDARVGQLATFTDKNGFVSEVLDPGGELTKGEAKEVNGTPAIGLVTKGTDGGTLYVATEGEPYPLQLSPEGSGTDEGKLDFLEYDAPVEVQIPPAAQTVDVTKLAAN